MTNNPSHQEQSDFAIHGIDVALGEVDAVVSAALKLQAQYPNHLVFVQAGSFLLGYDRTAYAMFVLKSWKLKLVGITADPHIKVGFPISNHKRRLWPVVNDLGIPYLIALGALNTGYKIYISRQENANASILASVSDDIVHQVIEDLRKSKQLDKASAQKQLSNPDSAPFHMKAKAQELDGLILQDIIKLPRDLRTTWGENLRACMFNLMRRVFIYGQEDNKPQLLKQLSADVDLLKHYITQAPKLSQLKTFNFEHRAGLAVELGRLIGGLIRSKEARP